MGSSSGSVVERYSAVIAAAVALPLDVLDYRELDEATVLQVSGLHTELARLVGAAGAVIAGDLAYRSRPELGGEGLARRTGHRTVENLLKNTTGATKGEVFTAVSTGVLLTDIAGDGRIDAVTGEVRQASQPWLRAVAEAMGAGRISTSASVSIARGLGVPNSAISCAQLEAAAVDLVGQAVAGMDADRLFRAACDLRNELDLAGVKLREDEGRALRALTHHPLPTGGGVASWRMDVETYAQFVDLYDRATSPKRGVRFVDPATVEKAKRIAEDPRDFKQLASDTFLNLLNAGAGVADRNGVGVSELMGSGSAIIRITVAEKALTTGVGLARVDGQTQPVSLDTVTRLIETATGPATSPHTGSGAGRVKTMRIPFDPNGMYVGVGDERFAGNRLFSAGQHEILAAKFGGCMDPDCDRPPSWTEAHHIQFVKRDGGKTVIANGILLCKYHHLLYHNHHYEILVDGQGRYWKIPPPTIDPNQTPIRMPPKTRNLNDLRAAEQRNQETPAAETRAAETRAVEDRPTETGATGARAAVTRADDVGR